VKIHRIKTAINRTNTLSSRSMRRMDGCIEVVIYKLILFNQYGFCGGKSLCQLLFHCNIIELHSFSETPYFVFVPKIHLIPMWLSMSSSSESLSTTIMFSEMESEKEIGGAWVHTKVNQQVYFIRLFK